MHKIKAYSTSKNFLNDPPLENADIYRIKKIKQKDFFFTSSYKYFAPKTKCNGLNLSFEMEIHIPKTRYMNLLQTDLLTKPTRGFSVIPTRFTGP